MKNLKVKLWWLIDPLKQISYGMAIYVLCAFIYGEVYAVQCITFVTRWTSTSGVIFSPSSTQIPVLITTATPNTCALLAITGAEYELLISNTATANNNATTANTNAFNAQNSANAAISSAQNANNNIDYLEQLANQAQSTATQALTLANEVNANLPSNNVDNILNISNQDAQTLMYAVLGLFVIAFVGRMYRKSVSIADTTSD